MDISLLDISKCYSSNLAASYQFISINEFITLSIGSHGTHGQFNRARENTGSPSSTKIYKHQEFQTSGTHAMHCEIITKEK
jgi:hypothetical protein